MNNEVESNKDMANKNHIVLSCDTLSTPVPEARQNLQMYSLRLTEDNIESVDEKVSHYNNCDVCVDSSEHIQSSEYVNYYDNESYVEQLKTEFPEDVLPQSDCSVDSEMQSENKELLKFVAKTETNDENTKDKLSLNIKEENDYNEYQFIVKTEGLEEQEDFNCEFYHNTLKNGCNLLQNSNKHVKVEINTPVDNGITELHQCQYCGKGFDDYNNMLVHISNDHKQENSKCDICGKQFKSVRNLNRHILAVHKLDKPLKPVTKKCVNCHMNFQHKCPLKGHSKLSCSGKEDGEDESENKVTRNITNYDYGTVLKCRYGKKFRSSIHLRKQERKPHPTKNSKVQCDDCKSFFKTKSNLLVHIRRVHYDYGKRFDCWCGKQFRSPLHLRRHDIYTHRRNVQNTNNVKFQCDYCKKLFTIKLNLATHIKAVHIEYGRKFECCCGKQFPSPIHLRKHERNSHPTNSNKFQCDYCKKIFKTKWDLAAHIKGVHFYDDRKFECWCGKQFRSPRYLRQHERHMHQQNVQNINNVKLQCDYCKIFFKTKSNLVLHIMRLHYDYGKRFNCWCGKQFNSPIHLGEHERRIHRRNVQNTNNDKFQCDYCKVILKNKRNLISHTKRLHYDYGKRFDCWCGKQFSSPIHLYEHERRIHRRNVQNTNNGKFKCEYCKIFFMNKGNLILHTMRLHYDYGKRFDCWCGKQFNSPIHLDEHERRIHRRNVQNTNNGKFQCDYCKIFLINKRNLNLHIQRLHYDYGKRFDCLCGKQFNSPIHLREHERRIHKRNVQNTNNG